MMETVPSVVLLIETVCKDTPRAVTPIMGKGSNNMVFAVDMHPSCQWIVRMTPAEVYCHVYHKEERAMVLARAAGVPVPEVRHVGYGIIPFSYSILEFLPGQLATEYDGPLEQVWEQVGRYAAMINAIELERYGFNIDDLDPAERLHQDWRTFLDACAQRFDLDLMTRHGVIRDDDAHSFKERFECLGELVVKPTLVHGDLLLRNILVDAGGQITGLLDWGNAASLVAPYFEFAQLFLGMETPEQAQFQRNYLQSFLRGYGLSRQAYADVERDIVTVQLAYLLALATRCLDIQLPDVDTQALHQNIEELLHALQVD